jgi:putative aldouronate transport system permease protein
MNNKEETFNIIPDNKPPSTQRISFIMNLLFTIFFCIITLVCILPVMLVVMASITDDMTLIKEGYTLFPRDISFKAYELIFDRSDALVRAFYNSIVISVFGTFIATFIMALYAYPLSRVTFRFRKGFTWYVLITMLFSGGLVPWFILYSQVLGLLDTMAVLIIPYTMSAWYVLILRTFYRATLPEEILESARIDGASEFRIFFSIAIPLSTAGLATVALFTMLGYWNDWYLPLIFSRSDRLDTIQNYLRRVLESVQFLARMASQMGSVTIPLRDLPTESIRMAIAVVAIGPIVLAYPFFQRYFIKGLTIGAIKG